MWQSAEYGRGNSGRYDYSKSKSRMNVAKQPARVISVASGKGGVGKTHTTVNLGVALTKLGKRVLLLDADLGLANINILLGFKPSLTLEAVLSGEKSLSEVIVHYPIGIKGETLDVIPASSGITDVTHLSEEKKHALAAALDDFGLEYDYLIIDTGAGIGSNVLYFNMASEQILVVIDPEPTSITDAYALIKVLSTQHDTKSFDVLVNRVPLGGDGRAIFSKLAAATDKFLPARLNYLGAVAEDSAISESVIQQKPLLQLFPTSRAARDYHRLASKIANNEGTRTPKGGLQFFFKALLESSF